jgi:uncharacterized protein (TIGR02118 family)
VIRISALYPNAPGSRFDADYYVTKHTPFAHDLLGPHGLDSIRTTLGIAGLDGAAPPFWVIAEMVFGSRQAFDDAMAACGATLFADIVNYTDVSPVLQVSALQED